MEVKVLDLLPYFNVCSIIDVPHAWYSGKELYFSIAIEQLVLLAENSFSVDNLRDWEREQGLVAIRIETSTTIASTNLKAISNASRVIRVFSSINRSISYIVGCSILFCVML